MAAKDRSALGNELNDFAVARTMQELESTALPLLEGLCEARGLSTDRTSIIQLVRGGVEHLPEAWMRGGAEVLLVGEARWGQTLGDRQLAAGEQELGLTSKHGWTRKQKRSLSYHDQLLEALASAITDPPIDDEDSVGAEPGDAHKPASPVGPATATAGDAMTGRLIMGGAVVLAALIVGWLVFGRGGDDTATQPDPPATATAISEPTAAPAEPAPTAVPEPTVAPTSAPVEEPTVVEVADATSCDSVFGDGGASLSSTQQDELARWASRMEELADSRCAAGQVAAFGDGLIQELKSPAGEPSGVVIVGPGSTPVYLTESQYISYLEIAGRGNAENSRFYGGYPVSSSIDNARSASVIELSGGGLLAGRHPDQIHFWVSTNVDIREKWEATGGLTGDLGLPMSNPFQPLGLSTDKPWYQESWWYQEYEFGSIVAPFLDSEQASIEYPDDRLAPLDGLDLRGEVVNQAGGQAWLFDDNEVAHWIPSAAVFDCVSGERPMAMRDVPGYTIAAFDHGPVATCAG